MFPSPGITPESDAVNAFLVDPADGTGLVLDPNGTLDVTPTTINDLRRAYALQRWLEKMARGGSRLIEVIKAHFNVSSSDKRLQRPEFIVGSKSPVVISEVLNTTGTDSLPQGNMAGHAISVTNGRMGSYYCEEHGYIIGIMSIIPRTAYQQGIARHWLKINDPTEYPWPSFANIGEQEVFNREIFAFQGGDAGGETWGYLPRYSEYKYASSRVAGQFRSSLDFWHWGRIFGGPPALNSDFITCKPDKRIFAVTDPDVDCLFCHVFIKNICSRPLPKYGTPI